MFDFVFNFYINEFVRNFFYAFYTLNLFENSIEKRFIKTLSDNLRQHRLILIIKNQVSKICILNINRLNVYFHRDFAITNFQKSIWNLTNLINFCEINKLIVISFSNLTKTKFSKLLLNKKCFLSMYSKKVSCKNFIKK